MELWSCILALSAALTPLAAHAGVASADPLEASLRAAREHADARGFAMAAVASPALAANAFGAAGVARVGLQLPERAAACAAGAAECWLVIYLEGFDSPAGSFEALARGLRARPHAPPVVFVALDGRTALGGSWYVDSKAFGAWESFVIKALIPAARRALAPGTPPSRTLILGHSMGGFGALHLAFAHPRMFGGAAAFEPVCRTVKLAKTILAHLAQGVDHFDGSFFYSRLLLSMGAAFHDQRPLIAPALRPWRLSAQAERALARFDIATAPAAHPTVRIYVGRRDPLVSPADLRGLSGPGVALRVTDGDHLSGLPADLRDALEALIPVPPAK